MGLRESVYWMHWFITYFLLSIPAAIILAFGFWLTHYYEKSSVVVIFLFCFLYHLSIVASTFTSTIFVSRVEKAGTVSFLVPFLLTLGTSMFFFFVNDSELKAFAVYIFVLLLLFPFLSFSCLFLSFFFSLLNMKFLCLFFNYIIFNYFFFHEKHIYLLVCSSHQRLCKLYVH